MEVFLWLSLASHLNSSQSYVGFDILFCKAIYPCIIKQGTRPEGTQEVQTQCGILAEMLQEQGQQPSFITLSLSLQQE